MAAITMPVEISHETAATIARTSDVNPRWKTVFSELIDNALEHAASDGCSVVFTLSGRRLVCNDNGRGADDVMRFFRPGQSHAGGGQHGNSTFGLGLFMIQSRLNCSKRVITSQGKGIVLDGFSKSPGDGRVLVDSLKKSRTSGTSVQFDNIDRSMKIPRGRSIEKIAAELGRCYAEPLNDGTLSVQIVMDGKPIELQPWQPPELLPGKSHETTIVHDNHSYTVRCGITAEVYKEIGTRLIYGGKWFCTDARPTGQFSTKRFYSELRIPKSVGFDVMQTTKEAVSFAKMKDVFQKCMDVFLPLLEEADGLARNEADQELADRLSDRLSVAYRRLKPQVELGDGEKRYAVPGGTEDLRNVESRDPEGIGVEPQNTGIKRRGWKRPGETKGRGRRLPKKKVITPDAITTQYHELEGSELARFDYGTGVLHVNEANTNTRRLYEAGKAGDDVSEVKLAIIGAAAVARGVEGNDPSSVQLTMGFKETSFDLVFAEMIARMEG